MGILQLLGGYSTFLYVFLPPSSDFLILLFWIYYFVFAVLSSLWVWFGKGAEVFVESGFVQGIKNPGWIKLFFPLSTVVIIVILFTGHQLGLFEEMISGAEAILYS